MHTTVHNELLRSKEYKAHLIVEAVNAFFVYSGYSHYNLTSVFVTWLQMFVVQHNDSVAPQLAYVVRQNFFATNSVASSCDAYFQV